MSAVEVKPVLQRSVLKRRAASFRVEAKAVRERERERKRGRKKERKKDTLERARCCLELADRCLRLRFGVKPLLSVSIGAVAAHMIRDRRPPCQPRLSAFWQPDTVRFPWSQSCTQHSFRVVFGRPWKRSGLVWPPCLRQFFKSHSLIP